MGMQPATFGCAFVLAKTHYPPNNEKGSSMSILISALITFLVVILILYLVNMLPVEGRIKHIIRIVVIIIGVLSLLQYLRVF
jgi:hypothetical protein